jgi:hypothetical protein
MDTNYPIMRLIDSGGQVRFGRTFNWSSTSIMTGNTPVSTEFTLSDTDLAGGPGGPGFFNLEVSSSGNRSDLIDFAGPVWVDFNFNGTPQVGAFAGPYKTLGAAVSAAASLPAAGRTIHIKGPGTSAETFPSGISVPMTIISTGGTVTIGH